MSTPYNPLESGRPELTIPLQDGTEEQISIIVVHNDKPEYLNICLQSITLASSNNNYELIVVDNGSKKESQDYLDSIQDEVKVIRNEKNLYFSAAVNKGIAAASRNSKYYLVLHHDVVVLKPEWIDLMLNVAESQHSGMIGLELGQYYIQGQKADFVQDWCILYSKECWNAIGPLPETLPQIGHSFVMTMRAHQKGFKPQAMKNPVCHHYHVFSLDINEYERLSEKAMKILPQEMKNLQSL